MAKAKTAYLCSECGAHSVKWAGQCPDCGAWNTLAETTISTPRGEAMAATAATTLSELPDDVEARHSTGFSEFDRVLGGGLVPGAVTLLGGDPGVGKSTLLQQVSAHLMQDLPVCYATGEESLRQIGATVAATGARCIVDEPAGRYIAGERDRAGAQVRRAGSHY